MDNVNAVDALPEVRQDFLIPQWNLLPLQAKFEKLNRRATKNGLDPIVLTVTGEVVIRHLDEHDHETANPMLVVKHVAYVPIRVEGRTPRVNGWDFCATLQHLGEDGNVIRAVPGLEIHIPISYRTARPVCDHCHQRRDRKDTYILRNVASGEFKQVGTNCLADFIRTGSAEDMATMAELLASAMDAAGDAGELGYGGGSGSSLTGFLELTNWVVAVVRVEGAFISKSKARMAGNEHATVTTALQCMFGRGREADQMRANHRPQDGDLERAKEIISWGRENLPAMVAADEQNDYLYNLSVAIKRDYHEPRLSGICASLITVYNRDLAKKALAKMNRETLGGSKHFGVVGERIKMLGVTLLHTFSCETRWGTTFITKMLTDSGDVAVWFASGRALSKAKTHVWTAEELEQSRLNCQSMNIPWPHAYKRAGDTVYLACEFDPVEYGERVILNATVKKHDERDGVQQTILSRCTVWTPEAVETELARQARKEARASKSKKATKAVKSTEEA